MLIQSLKIPQTAYKLCVQNHRFRLTTGLGTIRCNGFENRKKFGVPGPVTLRNDNGSKSVSMPRLRPSDAVKWRSLWYVL